MEEIQQTAEVETAEDFQPSVEVHPSGGNRKKTSSLRKQENIIGWIYIAPMLIGLCVFSAVPIIMSIISMFYEWNGTQQLFEAKMVGFDNFARIFGGLYSKRFWDAFGNTLLFAINLPLGLIIGMFLALAMNRDMRGVQAFRIIYYIPCVMSVVAVTIVWQKLFTPNGIIDNMFGNTGEGQFLWLNSRAGIVITVILLQIWKGVGHTALMFIAGLQSVSTDQIEAAKIDGATGWTILIKITMPALYPIIFYLFVTGLMGAMQVFNEVFILSGEDGYQTVVGLVYYFGQTAKNYGLASVTAWLLAVIIFIITAIQMYIDKKKQEAE